MNLKNFTIGAILVFLLVGSAFVAHAAITNLSAPTEAYLGSSTNQARGSAVTSTFILKNNDVANITGIDITNSNIPTSYSLQFSNNGTDYYPSLTAIDLVPGDNTIYIKGNISENIDSGARTLGNINVTTSTESVDIPLKINLESKLKIQEVIAKFRNEEETGLNDGDSFDDVRPGDELTLTVTVKNKYSDSDDIAFDDVEITVLIEDLDDGDEVEKTSSKFRLKEGLEDSKTFTFDVPLNADEEDYNIIVTVTGDSDLDSGTATHDDINTIEMTVEKLENDVQITDFSSDKTTLSCDRNANLHIKLENFGSLDQDEARITIKNDLLNINYEKKEIELSNDLEDDDSKFSVTVPITVDSKALADTYKLRAQVYFEDTIVDDIKDLDLEVKDCGSDTTTTDNTNPKETGTPVTDFTRPSTPTSNYSSLLGLVTLIMFGGLVVTSVLLYRARK